MGDLDALDSELDNLESELGDDESDELDEALSKIKINSGSLAHYASEYYDPVKAHEYYMKNRQLKGRSTSTKLNEEGRKVASYVKKQISEERKNKVASDRAATDSQITSLRNQTQSEIQKHSVALQKRIEFIRSRLQSMSGKDKIIERAKLQVEIDSMRKENAEKRAKLQAEFKGSSDKLRKAHSETSSSLKEEADAKYESELSKIRSEGRYQKVSKRKKK